MPASKFRRAIVIYEDTWAKVTLLAKHDDSSASQIVRNALKEYISKRRTLANRARKARQG